MKLQNRIRRISIDCPGERSIEEILLHAQNHPIVFSAFQSHLLTCRRCARIVKRMHVYYEILEEELARPLSPKVVDFARTLYEKVQAK
jgi:hypothetical protein